MYLVLGAESVVPVVTAEEQTESSATLENNKDNRTISWM